jgi:hypothetical protein
MIEKPVNRLLKLIMRRSLRLGPLWRNHLPYSSERKSKDRPLMWFGLNALQVKPCSNPMNGY